MAAKELVQGSANILSKMLSALPSLPQIPIFTDNALALLRQQHREVEGIFAEFEQAGERAFRYQQRLVALIKEKLLTHIGLEEQYFYPEAKAVDPDLITESYEEHENIKSMLKKITATQPGHKNFQARIKVLKEQVEHHVQEEENDLFPRCTDALGEDRLNEIGRRMQAVIERNESAKLSKSMTRKRTMPKKKRTVKAKARVIVRAKTKTMPKKKNTKKKTRRK